MPMPNSAQGFQLTNEVSSSPMSPERPRLGNASQGAERNAVKMLGYDGANSCPALQLPAEDSPDPAPPASLSGRTPTNRLARNITQQLQDSPLATRSKTPASIPIGDNGNLNAFCQGITTPESSATVLGRRGYRPLSIVTSALFPFEFDPVEAMEALRGGKFSREELEKKYFPADPQEYEAFRAKHIAMALERKKQYSEETATGRAEASEGSESESSTKGAKKEVPSTDDMLFEMEKLTTSASHADSDSDGTPSPSKPSSPRDDTSGVLDQKVNASRETVRKLTNDAKTSEKPRNFSKPTLQATQQNVAAQASLVDQTPPSLPAAPAVTDIDFPAPGFRAERRKPFPDNLYYKGQQVFAVEVDGPRDPKTGYPVGWNAEKVAMKNNAASVSDRFPCLVYQCPPELDQHPAFAADPFTSEGDAPLMSTQWTVDQVRTWAKEKHKGKPNLGSAIVPPPEGAPTTAKSKRKVPNLTLFSANKETDIYDILAEGSPEPVKERPPQTGLEAAVQADPTASTVDLRLSSTTTRISTPTTSFTHDDFEKRSGTGLRSFSNLFKPKSSSTSDKASFMTTPLSSSQQNPASPELKRINPERYLRITTNSPRTEYHPLSLYPQHPNTFLDWTSRNLKCTKCSPSACKICRRTCCAYRAAVLGLENHANNPTNRDAAYSIVMDITRLFPYGRELPTFMTCTECEETVCPDCCGMCPDESCQLICCRRCKGPNPFEECGWHKGGVVGGAMRVKREGSEGEY